MQVCQHTGGLHGVSSMGGFTENGYSATVLCNQGDVDVEEFLWVLYNFVLELPLETKHYWAMPTGEDFSQPEMLCGDYFSNEGLPAHTVVTYEDGMLKADYNGIKTLLQYCGGLSFAVVSDLSESTVETTF